MVGLWRCDGLNPRVVPRLRDGRGARHALAQGARTMPGTHSACSIGDARSVEGLRFWPRTDVPSQTDFWQERLVVRNALRAQTLFEGALTGNRVGRITFGVALKTQWAVPTLLTLFLLACAEQSSGKGEGMT